MKIKQIIASGALVFLAYFAPGCTEEKPWSLPSAKQGCIGTPVEDIPNVDARGSMAEYRTACKQLNKDNINYRLEAKQTDNGIDISLFLNANNNSSNSVYIRYITCLTERIGGWSSSCMLDIVKREIKGPFTKGQTIEDKVILPGPKFKKDVDGAYVLPQAIIYSDSAYSTPVGKVGAVFPARLRK